MEFHIISLLLSFRLYFPVTILFPSFINFYRPLSLLLQDAIWIIQPKKCHGKFYWGSKTISGFIHGQMSDSRLLRAFLDHWSLTAAFDIEELYSSWNLKE